MKVSGDCNTAFFKKMGASESDISIFKEMGIDIIRMDLPYFDQRDVTLINNPYNITIELSSCMIQAVRMALENGANPKNFSTCHNFYPERYTASDLESIRSVNKELATLGIPSAVFISSNEDNTHGPWPVHDGLPTVEDHRWIPAELQVRHWIAVGDVDEIIFGNAFASEEEFKAIDQVMNQAYVNIPKLVGQDYLAELLPHGDVERVPFKVVLDREDRLQDLYRRTFRGDPAADLQRCAASALPRPAVHRGRRRDADGGVEQLGRTHGHPERRSAGRDAPGGRRPAPLPPDDRPHRTGQIYQGCGEGRYLRRGGL